MNWVNENHKLAWEKCQLLASELLIKTGGVTPLRSEPFGKEWWELVEEKRHHEEKGVKRYEW